MKLVVGNKRYSSWSLRPWILLTELKIPFDEVVIQLDAPGTKAEIAKHTPAGRVPVLIDAQTERSDVGPTGVGAKRRSEQERGAEKEDVRVWESLAIMEYVAESRPEVWPRDKAARAMARAISSEMHAGFAMLRKACPMNLGKKFGPRDRGVEKDVARITDLWREARTRYGKGGPFLFGAFTAADAMYAPVVTRFDTYSIAVEPDIRAYMGAVLGTRAFREWREAALREMWVIAADEIDEKPTEVYQA